MEPQGASQSLASGSNSRSRWSSTPSAAARTKARLPQSQAPALASLLSPAITEGARASLFSIPLPSAAQVTWRKWTLTSRDTLRSTTEKLGKQALSEARWSAHRWMVSQQVGSKGKARDLSDDWQEAILDRNFWITSLVTSVTGVHRCSKDEDDLAESAEQAGGHTVSRSRLGTHGEADALMQPVASAQETVVLWVFKIVGKGPSSKSSPIGKSEMTPASTSQNVEAPNDEDLWGESPAESLLTTQKSDAKGAKLEEECWSGMSDLEEHLRQELPEPERGSWRPSELYEDGSTPPGSHELMPRLEHRESYLCFRRALSTRLAEVYVARSRSQSFTSSTTLISQRVCGVIGAAGGQASQSFCSEGPEAGGNEIKDEEDRKILEQDRFSETAAPEEDFEMATAAKNDQRHYRLAVRHRHGFILRWAPQDDVRLDSLCPPLLTFGFFDAAFSPSSLSRRDCQDDGEVLLVRLDIEGTLMTSTDFLDAAHTDIVLGPDGLRARKTGACLSLHSVSTDGALRAHKEHLAEILALRTGLDYHDLASDQWLVLQSKDDVGKQSIIWPKLLCYAAHDSGTMLQPSSTQTGTLTCMPVATIVQRTAALLKHQQDVDDKLRNVHNALNTAAGPAEAPSRQHEEPTPQRVLLPSGENHTRNEAQDLANSQDRNDDSDDADLFGSEPENSPVRANSKPPAAASPEMDRPSLSCRPSKTELDEGMYGLVTEDDFAFFDESEDEDEATHAKKVLKEGIRSADERQNGGMAAKQDILMKSHPDSRETVQIHQHYSERRDSMTIGHEEVTDESRILNTAGTSSGSPTDPSTVPGFTPASLTDSSPTTEGLLERTPKTPTSPYYDGSLLAHRGLSGGFDIQQDGWTSIQDTAPTTQSAVLLQQQARNGISFNGSIPHDSRRPALDDQAHASEDLASLEEKPHRTLRGLGDKYNSGKFALPDSAAAGIAGSGKRLKTSIAPTQTNLGQLTVHQSSAKGPMTSSIHKMRNMLRGDDETSEPGTMASTASYLSDDEEDEDDSESSTEATDEEQRSERLAAWLEIYKASIECAQWRSNVVDSLDHSTRSNSEEAAEAAEDASAQSDRDDCIDWLLSNLVHISHTLSLDANLTSSPALLHPADRYAILFTLSRCGIASVQQAARYDEVDEPGKTSPLGEIEVLEPPNVIVGCQGSLTRMVPSCLLFWEKLGLSAAGGGRTITSLVLYHSASPKPLLLEMRQWLESVRFAFSQLGLGTHDLAPDGLLEIGDHLSTDIAGAIADILAVPDRREEILVSLISRFLRFLGPDHHIVLYTVGHDAAASLSSCAPLRLLQIELRQMAQTENGLWQDHIHVRPLAWDNVVSSSWRRGSASLKAHIRSLYDHLRVAIGHQPLRQLQPQAASPTYLIRMPRFTLAIDSSEPVPFFMRCVDKKPIPLRRPAAYSQRLFLHVAYDAVRSDCGDFMCVAIMDEGGQQSFVKTARMQRPLIDLLRWVFQVALDSVPVDVRSCWRIVICRYGKMETAEMRAWTTMARQGVFKAAPCFDVTMTCLDRRTPFLANQTFTRPAGAAASESVLLDGSCAHFAVYPQGRILVPSTGSGLSGDQLLSLQTSIIVSLSRGSQDALIPRQGVEHAVRSTSVSAGYRCSWLHLLGTFEGGLQSALSSSSSGHESSPMKFLTHDLHDTIRALTKSLFGLYLVARERLPNAVSQGAPWTIAVLDVVSSILPNACVVVEKQAELVKRACGECHSASSDGDVAMAS